LLNSSAHLPDPHPPPHPTPISLPTPPFPAIAR
ncbi:hypothetical protein L249_1215, partial [Ophiocordyceps polyrhachis-furcata BCC 54312]